MIKRITIVTILFMIFSPFTAFAAELSVQDATQLTTNEEISPRAISGSGSGYCKGGGYGIFTIDSPGWGLWGHTDVTVGKNMVFLSIIYPDGSSVIDGGGMWLNPGNHTIKLLKPQAGTYTFKFQNMSGIEDGTYVMASLKDF